MKRIIIATMCAALIALVGCAGTGHSPGEPSREEPGYEQPDYQAPSYEDPADEPVSEEPPDTPGYTNDTPASFPGRVTLDYASEEEMADYPDAPRFVQTETGFWMVFRFDQPVSDVVHAGVTWADFDEDAGVHLFEPGVVMHKVGDLAAGQPFFLQAYGHIGTMPGQAIGFTYADGIRYYIPFDQSQMDGSLVLWKQSALTIDG